MPSNAQVLKFAVDQHRAGDVRRAAQSYREILRFDPTNADALHLLGVACHQQGEHATAIEFISRAIDQNATNPAFCSNLGAAYRAAGRFQEAVAAFQRALQIDPNHGDALFNLANSHRALGNLEKAGDYYLQYLKRYPQSVEALIALALIRQSQQQMDEAIECLQRIVEIAPGHAEAANDLGSLLKSAGRLEEAADVFDRLIAFKPELASAHHNLGNVNKVMKRYDAAKRNYEDALRLDPAEPSAHSNLAMLLQEMGETKEAAHRQLRAVALDPSPHRRIRLALMLPPIYESISDVRSWRDRLETEVDYLLDQGVTLDPSRDLVTPNFHLAYQGQNDRSLQAKISRLYQSTFDRGSHCSIAPHRDDRIHVGFVSHYLKEHTIGRLMAGIVNGLSRARFHVSVFSHGDAHDSIAESLRRHADEYVVLPSQLPAACCAIASRNLDVLFYCDIGMDPFTTSLAHSRLAKVQATTWGHPVTSGIGDIDNFVSSVLFEPENAEEHYSERLTLLNSTGILYTRPSAGSSLSSRAKFGLPDNKPLYACPQSLFKLHPEFDELLGEILRRDRRGLLILLSGHCENWNQLLLNRFRRSIADVVDRIHFLPRMTYDGFLALQQSFDVVLDPPHFCGGNTSLEALSFGVPIVTWPSPFLRGRLTYGFYREMQAFECVAGNAADYVNLAVRLGTDKAWRRHVRERIFETNHCLYENKQSVTEIERFFEKAAAGRDGVQDAGTRRRGDAAKFELPSPPGRGAGGEGLRSKFDVIRPFDEPTRNPLHHAESAAALIDRGNAFKACDDIPAAVACFRRSLGNRASDPLRRLWLASIFPTVFESTEQIDEYRSHLLSTIEEIGDSRIGIQTAQIMSQAFPPPFELLHHGADNRPIKEAFARLFVKHFPAEGPRVVVGKPRIGIVVTGGHERVFLRCLAGIVRRINPDLCDIHIVCTPHGRKVLGSFFDATAVKFLVVPSDFDEMLILVRDARFDVLWYWEIGSDVANYFLPFFQPAPVQCVSWGVPDTTGNPRVNYFLSSAALETPAAENHYTEHLIRANTLLTWQDRIALPVPQKSRTRFGFSQHENLYLCVQQIRKLHPDFDQLLAEILRRDGHGRAVVVGDASPEILQKLHRRMERSIPDLSERVMILPRLAERDYFDLIAAADVLLDTPHFGAGITAYDAFAVGKALVTLPGTFRRSRYATACYHKMGVGDCIATDHQEFANIATKLGTNRDYREAVENRIRLASSELFENELAVTACENILEQMIAEARAI